MTIETSTQIRIQSNRNWYHTVEDVDVDAGCDGCTISYHLDDGKRGNYITTNKEEALAIADAIYKLFKN